MCDSGDEGKQPKKPRLFLEWPNSGDPMCLVAADMGDLEHGYGILDDLRELLSGDYDEGEEVIIRRKSLTDAEVEALPEL